MASTRYPQPTLQIYQDPITSYDHALMPSSSSSSSISQSSAVKGSPLRALKNNSTRNIIFNPPTNGLNNVSPSKPFQKNSSSPLRAPLAAKLNTLAMPPPLAPKFQTDSIEKRQPTMSKFKTAPQKALFTTFSSSRPADKENYVTQSTYPTSAPYPHLSVNLPENGVYGQKAPGKRVLMESAPINESRPMKKLRETAEPIQPSSDEIAAPQDDGSKPGHSYAMLIGMAILKAPNRRLTLAQIYKWISDSYSYYSATEAGWQNSIRHNLSLNKAFIKQERPKDDPGKGNYWAIEPGMENQFVKEKQTRRQMTGTDNPIVLPATTSPSAGNGVARHVFQMHTSAPLDLPPSSSTVAPCEAISKPEPDLSSDATIPASDGILPEDLAEEDTQQHRPSSRAMRSSPPPQDNIQSSPPIPRNSHSRSRDDTPPPVPDALTSSRIRSHKRKFASMDDSGYFSSLDSSAVRPNPGNRLLTSEADRPRIKRGRAEEEIARLRHSSYDSPTKGRSFLANSAFRGALPSSSPLRHGKSKESNQMLPPLTPAVKLKVPARPPPSASPNTNLRKHRDSVRELVGSPLRGVTSLDNIPWSPAFNLDTEPYLFNDYNSAFDLFIDANSNDIYVSDVDSPIKPSAKRPRMDRMQTTSNVLGEVSTPNFAKNVTSAPIPKLTPGLFGSPFDSPCKGLGRASQQQSPTKEPLVRSASLSGAAFDLPHEEFFGSEFLADEIADFGGMDILQGFQKIGSGSQRIGNLAKNSAGSHSRPALARSSTSRF